MQYIATGTGVILLHLAAGAAFSANSEGSNKRLLRAQTLTVQPSNMLDHHWCYLQILRFFGGPPLV